MLECAHFMKIDKRFSDKVLMTPRFVFWECMEDCEQQFIDTNCFGGGKYCALDSDSSYLTG